MRALGWVAFALTLSAPAQAQAQAPKPADLVGRWVMVGDTVPRVVMEVEVDHKVTTVLPMFAGVSLTMKGLWGLSGDTLTLTVQNVTVEPLSRWFGIKGDVDSTPERHLAKFEGKRLSLTTLASKPETVLFERAAVRSDTAMSKPKP